MEELEKKSVHTFSVAFKQEKIKLLLKRYRSAPNK